MRKFEGWLPLLLAILLHAVVWLLEGQGWTLRSLPRAMLLVYTGLSIITMLVYFYRRLVNHWHFRFLGIIISRVLLILVGGAMAFYLFAVGVFSCPIEHVGIHQGKKTVAVVNRVLWTNVTYHTYINPWFYGEQIGDSVFYFDLPPGVDPFESGDASFDE